MRRIGLPTAALLIAAMAGWYLGRESGSNQEAATISQDDSSSGDREFRRRQNQLKLAAMRRQIAEVVDREVSIIEDEHELDRYLEALARRAKENGKVTALEVQPGIEAINRQYSGKNSEKMNEEIVAFSQKMALLSESFSPETGPSPPVDPDRIYDEVTQEADVGRQEGLVAKYVEQTYLMDPEAQSRALARLNDTVSQTRGPAEDVDFESMLDEIETTADSGNRQELIRRFLKSIYNAEPGSQAAWLERLNQLN